MSRSLCTYVLKAEKPYYKQNKGYFLGFLFKPLGGLRPSLDGLSFRNKRLIFTIDGKMGLKQFIVLNFFINVCLKL